MKGNLSILLTNGRKGEPIASVFMRYFTFGVRRFHAAFVFPAFFTFGVRRFDAAFVFPAFSARWLARTKNKSGVKAPHSKSSDLRRAASRFRRFTFGVRRFDAAFVFPAFSARWLARTKNKSGVKAPHSKSSDLRRAASRFRRFWLWVLCAATTSARSSPHSGPSIGCCSTGWGRCAGRVCLAPPACLRSARRG